MPNLVYVLVLLLSLHACSARHLSFTDKSIGIKSHRIIDVRALNSYKDVHNTKLQSSHINSKPIIVRAEADDLPNTGKGGDSIVTLKKDENKGRESVISHSQKEIQTEHEPRRQARSTLGSSPHEAKENVNSKENNIIEDVVAMDYAQPHRKPPIHNRKL